MATGAEILPFLQTVDSLSTHEMTRTNALLTKPIYVAFPVEDMIAAEQSRLQQTAERQTKYNFYPGFNTNYTGQVALTDYRVLLAGIVRKVFSAARTAVPEATEGKEAQDAFETPRDLVKWMESINMNLRSFEQEALSAPGVSTRGNIYKRSASSWFTLVHDLDVMEDLLKVVKAMEIVDAMKALSKDAKAAKVSEEKLAEAISLKATVTEAAWPKAEVVKAAVPYFKAVKTYVTSYVKAVLDGKDDATLEANLSAVKDAYVKCLAVKDPSVLIAKAPEAK